MDKILSVILIFFIISIEKVNAQQTVFNVPNADVTEKGKLFIEHESQFRGESPGAFWQGTHYSAFGIGHNTELDVTSFNVDAPDIGNIATGVGFKSVIPIFEKNEFCKKREFKITVGSEVLIPCQNNGVGNWSYIHFSHRLPKINTRLTTGITVGTKQVFGRDGAVAFIGAIEQPITKKFSLIADWYSGNNNISGFLIAGMSYKLPKDSTIYLGYQIPNNPKNGKTGFVVEVSKIFDLNKRSEKRELK